MFGSKIHTIITTVVVSAGLAAASNGVASAATHVQQLGAVVPVTSTTVTTSTAARESAADHLNKCSEIDVRAGEYEERAGYAFAHGQMSLGLKEAEKAVQKLSEGQACVDSTPS